MLYIYGEEYDKALKDLEQCSNVMHQNKELYPKNQFPDEDLDDYSQTGSAKQDDNVSNASS